MWGTYATDVTCRLLTRSQTLYPTVDTKSVDLLLGKASDRLIQSLISEMEASQEDIQAIEQVRWSEVCLKVPWHAVLWSFRSACLRPRMSVIRTGIGQASADWPPHIPLARNQRVEAHSNHWWKSAAARRSYWRSFHLLCLSMNSLSVQLHISCTPFV